MRLAHRRSTMREPVARKYIVSPHEREKGRLRKGRPLRPREIAAVVVRAAMRATAVLADGLRFSTEYAEIQTGTQADTSPLALAQAWVHSQSRPETGMSDRLRLLPAHEYRRERWRNGLGWTREIHRQPMSDVSDYVSSDANEVQAETTNADWLWRLSIAEVEHPAAFSAFPGIDRELVLLRGNGMRLCFDDGETVTLDPPHGRYRFPGERPLRGEPIDGITHDFNLMWRRDRIEAELWHRPLVGSMVLFAEPGDHWVVHVLSGRANAADGARILSASIADTFLLHAADARMRVALDGGGEVLVIRLRARRSVDAGSTDTDSISTRSISL